MRRRHWKNHGFTLIELSIVLVIIGLIIGGILIGQVMIGQAGVRAQLAQIEKYNSAVNTFRTKYYELPGDLDAASAAQFGFVTRAGTQGRGNSNGLIEGYRYGTGVFSEGQGGETLFFWEDLSQANMIEGVFNTATDAAFSTLIYRSEVPLYLPAAKLGNGNFLYVWSQNGINFFTVENFTVPAASEAIDLNGYPWGMPSMTVAQASAIDTKIDDGLPTSGKVQAMYVQWGVPGFWSSNATSPSATTCFDTTSNKYSTGTLSSANVNCALSFQMQGAAR
jgi:prepilin-type N-terminal cleavage/methylation domain-containing protein